MARARRGGTQSKQKPAQATATPASSQGATGAETLTCPECGKTFSRPAALGAHRARAHGVAGSSRSRGGSRTRGASSRNGTGRSTRASSTGSSTTTTGSPRRTRRPAASNRVDRDALLQLVFPNGVPAREAVIRELNAFLDEAERLAKL